MCLRAHHVHQPSLEGIPLLILGNKCDVEGALSVDAIQTRLAVSTITGRPLVTCLRYDPHGRSHFLCPFLSLLQVLILEPVSPLKLALAWKSALNGCATVLMRPRDRNPFLASDHLVSLSLVNNVTAADTLFAAFPPQERFDHS
jgi:hypothetical protein